MLYNNFDNIKTLLKEFKEKIIGYYKQDRIKKSDIILLIFVFIFALTHTYMSVNYEFYRNFCDSMIKAFLPY